MMGSRMGYRYAERRPEHADLASGSVLHSLPGRPAFPVRLASELLLRCLAVRAEAGLHGPALVHDPCCGGASLLTALGFLHPERLRGLIGSDLDPDAVRLARRNLALLTPDGLDARIGLLRERLAAYGRDSYAEAVERAGRLRARLAGGGPPASCFTADAADPAALRRGLGGDRPDVVLTDLPYGRASGWAGGVAARPGPDGAPGPAWLVLDALAAVVGPGPVIAVVTDKAEPVAHDGFRRLERLQLGHRRAAVLVPADGQLGASPRVSSARRPRPAGGPPRRG